MSKYEPLWDYLKDRDEKSLLLSFQDIAEILHFEMDHSFLNYKKELLEYGYEVQKISLKNKTVLFQRINE